MHTGAHAGSWGCSAGASLSPEAPPSVLSGDRAVSESGLRHPPAENIAPQGVLLWPECLLKCVCWRPNSGRRDISQGVGQQGGALRKGTGAPVTGTPESALPFSSLRGHLCEPGSRSPTRRGLGLGCATSRTVRNKHPFIEAAPSVTVCPNGPKGRRQLHSLAHPSLTLPWLRPPSADVKSQLRPLCSLVQGKRPRVPPANSSNVGTLSPW